MIDHKPFYILSTGRAGSTFMAQLIESQSSFDYDLHQQPFSRSINIKSNQAFGNPDKESQFVEKYLQLFGSDKPNSTCDPLQSMSLLYYLKHKKPEANVVHLVRDPREVISSFMNWKNRKLSGKIAHHLVPNWMPHPLQDGSMSLLQYAFLPKYTHYAWIWNFKNKLFAELNQLDTYRLFRLEDIRSSEEKMSQLLQHIEVDDTLTTEQLSKKVNKSEKSGFPQWEDWTPEMCSRVDRICGEQMRSLGYGQENLWKEKLEKA